MFVHVNVFMWGRERDGGGVCLKKREKILCFTIEQKTTHSCIVKLTH